ncbi:prolyl oligopeptidase family serine peptidase [Gordonia otitidis]|uniref:Peptidase S9 family protein n=1 Tax=Gordonia otitidis (strain DSM 44809 / CCUG 52243 / JCM 12355 / NBRC 100426 / IFM 10032) TaxID=1108044 RepID=H5TLW2_GORO1|nr:prolyl oligopeptidase family serine peptidase [Gordonia otitidis]UEA60396.1 prolyl oligopeptidase family serine peptidase [Gordonia otitidis]GAB34470.1 peptidase S9 family protein [Gordonia otitidis NBRC 100426]
MTSDATTGTDDPYLWLEEVTADRSLDWVREHNAPTVERLTTSKRFAEIEEQTLEALDTDDRIPYVRRRGEFLYNFWRDAANPRGLWRRTTLESYVTDAPEWDVLIDVDQLAKDEDENWVWKGATALRPDYRRVLISLSRGGADAAVVREFDLTTRSWVTDGFTLPENKSSVSWIDEDNVYVGTDFGIAPDGHSSLTDSGYPRIAKRWRRGTPLDEAVTVFVGEPSDISIRAVYDDTPGFERHFISRSTDFFNSLLYENRAGDLVLVDVPTDAYAGVRHDWLLVMTRSQWSPTGPEGPTYDPGTLLVFDYPSYLDGNRDAVVLFEPDAHTSLVDFAFTEHYLIITTLHDVHTSIAVLTAGDWTPVEVNGLPDMATISVLDTDPDHSDEVFWSATSFTEPPSLLHGTIGAGDATVIKRSPEFFDASSVTTEQYFATSDDGTLIPYFVVRRTDVTHGPALLYGYGGFENALTPGYLTVAGRAWIERGGIYVIANIRGGGEYGPAWHTVAQKSGRHLVYEDFSSVARDLVTRRFTTPAQLGAQGGSNGGLLMGVMLTRYPELFGALVCQVPLIDMYRYHLLLAGASWVAEYGNPEDPAEWAFMEPFSPYQNIRRDVKYPPILVTTSTRDDRVHPGHARKLVARLEENGHTVDYYENIEGGHGGAADNKQAAFKSALAYEFLWETLADDVAE